MKTARRVKFVFVAARNHIHIYIQQNRIFFHRQIGDKMAAALQTGFFGIESDENQRIRRLFFVEIFGKREERGCAGCVVVRAVVNFAFLHADVIVMRCNNNVFSRVFLSFDNADDVCAFGGFGIISGFERKVLQIRISKRFQARIFKSFFDVFARFDDFR